MKSILFVDDERSILNGLKRSLRGQRNEWRMEFAEGGAEALRLMLARPFDAIVTDMRMPGMDGNELLKQVASRYPQTIRIILSGHLDETRNLRSAGLAHQFFAKPCAPDTLRDSLNRTLALRDRLQHQHLQSFVSGLNSLPSIPDVFLEIRAALQDPNVSLRRIGELVKRDPAMSAKVLQLVNSAFLGVGRQVSEIGDAVVYVGLDTLKSLVLSVGIFSQFDPKVIENPAFTPAALWGHCTAVAAAAKRIAEAEGAANEVIDFSFLAGLLHDTGILIMERNYPVKYGEVGRLVIQEGMSLQQAEQEIFGTTHSAVGAYLLGLWSLPEQVVEAVALHHEPTPCLLRGFSPLAAVHVADILKQKDMPDEVSKNQKVDETFLAAAGLTDKLERWSALLASEET